MALHSKSHRPPSASMIMMVAKTFHSDQFPPYHISVFFAVTDVTIGLQQTVHSVTEGDSFALVCTAVLSGGTAGRTLTFDYETSDDSAEGSYI